MQKIDRFAGRLFSQQRWMQYSFVGLVLLLWLTTSKAKVFQSSDTLGWIIGSKGFVDCIFFVNLDACQSISYWPIWNNALAVIFGWFADDQIKLWYYLNIAAFVVYVLIIISLIQGLDHKWRLLIIFSILLSPLLFQAHSTFTETQQGLLLTLAFLALLRRRMAISLVLISLSITIKETFLLLWILILIFVILKEILDAFKIAEISESERGLAMRFVYFCRNHVRSVFKGILFNHQIQALIIGILVGSLITFLFNYLRYHHFSNRAYYSLNTQFSMRIQYAVFNFIWSLISPNGGLVFSYGVLMAIVILILTTSQVNRGSRTIISGVNLIRIGDNDRSTTTFRILIELIAFNIIILSYGLLTTSLWWAAFGWDTWGNRLIIPYIMPIIMLIIMSIQDRGEHREQSIGIMEMKYLDKNCELINRSFPVKNKLIIISIIILVICGLMYNMVTIQAVYRKNVDVVGESLFSQPWCRKMVSDGRGIRPYYWRCVLERFQYIPILHRPPKILGPEGKILISMAIMSVFVNLPCMRPWRQGNRLVEPHARSDRG